MSKTIELTNRLMDCRTKTRFHIVRHNMQAGCHTIEVVNTVTRRTYQWSANTNHPDSAVAWARFRTAYDATVANMPTNDRSNVFLDLVTSPAQGKGWENFFWSVSGPKPVPAPEPVDNIMDLFGGTK